MPEQAPPQPGQKDSESAGVDLSRLNELTLGDAVLRRGLVETFIESGKRAVADIHAGLAKRDFMLTRRAAHTLKGASANMGAHGLYQACAALESAVEAQSVEMNELSKAVGGRFAAACEIFERERDSR